MRTRPASGPVEKNPCPPDCPRIQKESAGICAVTRKRSHPLTTSTGVTTTLVAGPECDQSAALSANDAVLSRHDCAKQSATARASLLVESAKYRSITCRAVAVVLVQSSATATGDGLAAVASGEGVVLEVGIGEGVEVAVASATVGDGDGEVAAAPPHDARSRAGRTRPRTMTFMRITSRVFRMAASIGQKPASRAMLTVLKGTYGVSGQVSQSRSLRSGLWQVISRRPVEIGIVVTIAVWSRTPFGTFQS